MANFNFNRVILGGRLTADPEQKTTQSGLSVCSFSLAVNRRGAKDGNQQTDFINCTAWRERAELICRYFHKGSSICIVGSIQTRTYTDKDNQKRYATEVIVNEVYFVDSKAESTQGGNNHTPCAQNAPQSAQSYIPEAYTNAGGFENVTDDDDLPL